MFEAKVIHLRKSFQCLLIFGQHELELLNVTQTFRALERFTWSGKVILLNYNFLRIKIWQWRLVSTEKSHANEKYLHKTDVLLAMYLHRYIVCSRHIYQSMAIHGDCELFSHFCPYRVPILKIKRSIVFYSILFLFYSISFMYTHMK